ncbi:MAG: D-alanyl-D-alanine carboxypeptidase family protein, partial [Opitutaceae bacterium]|nr:D-alanyl-D-alanine carboxypeptidase family protein [Opitutaceae bacterium]
KIFTNPKLRAGPPSRSVPPPGIANHHRSHHINQRCGLTFHLTQFSGPAHRIGFRSVAFQANIIREKLAGGEPISRILKLVAAPGFSEHHTGQAIDIGSPDFPVVDERFALTAEFRWLKKNAARFGFHLSYPRRNPHGIVYEPWHWCWQSRRQVKSRSAGRRGPRLTAS